MTTTKRTIGERFSEVLNTLQEKRLIKQQGTIAVNAGYTVATISEIKKDRMKPPGKIIDYLEKEYNVNPEYIYHGSGNVFKGNEIKEPQPEYKLKQFTESPIVGALVNTSEANKVLAQANKTLADAHYVIAKNNETLILLMQNSLGLSTAGHALFADPGTNGGSEGFAMAKSEGKKGKSSGH